VKHVFERILLCRTAEVATQLAKKARMDCVSLEGDLASSKGALTGGYVDVRQSKLQFYKQRAAQVVIVRSLEEQVESARGEITRCDADLNAVLNELQRHETKSKRTRDLHEQMRADCGTRSAEIERYERLRPQKAESLRSLRADVAALTNNREVLETELGEFEHRLFVCFYLQI
jgi:structural maintenance of chromosome 3 (chondroitin sulfate proteoglycan 6)